jgi:hypothetical protein
MVSQGTLESQRYKSIALVENYKTQSQVSSILSTSMPNPQWLPMGEDTLETHSQLPKGKNSSTWW